MDISINHVPQKHFLGTTETVAISELMHNTIFQRVYSTLGAHLAEKKIEMAGPPVAIYKSWEPDQDKTELMPAFAVGEEIDRGDFELFSVPEGDAYVGILHGAYAGLKEAHQAIMKKIADDGATPKLTVEEYTVGPETVVEDDCTRMDESKCVTTLYYYI